MMQTHYLPLRFVNTPYTDRVERICASWAGTLWVHGQCQKGVAVDCLHFGAAVLDELYGTRHSRSLRSLPTDACVHDREGVQVALRHLMTVYDVLRVWDGTVEAGDLVVTGPHGTFGHLHIAGEPGKLWHATPPRVAFTGYGLPDSFRIAAVLRAQDKNKWLSL